LVTARGGNQEVTDLDHHPRDHGIDESTGATDGEA
jgi:hypothetical protein